VDLTTVICVVRSLDLSIIEWKTAGSLDGAGGLYFWYSCTLFTAYIISYIVLYDCSCAIRGC